MPHEELNAEIQAVLATLPPHTLPEILDYLKAVQKANPTTAQTMKHVRDILREDAPLLKRLLA
ncbi:MAG: hypothetical protein AB8G15_14170 [Saprospiraceae bacterium]